MFASCCVCIHEVVYHCIRLCGILAILSTYDYLCCNLQATQLDMLQQQLAEGQVGRQRRPSVGYTGPSPSKRRTTNDTTVGVPSPYKRRTTNDTTAGAGMHMGSIDQTSPNRESNGGLLTSRTSGNEEDEVIYDDDLLSYISDTDYTAEQRAGLEVRQLDNPLAQVPLYSKNADNSVVDDECGSYVQTCNCTHQSRNRSTMLWHFPGASCALVMDLCHHAHC